MGRNKDVLNSSRSEFLSEDVLGESEEEYIKHGGWFVTTKKALALVFFAIFSLIFVITFMYYYGPKTKIEKTKPAETDIEEIIKEGLENKVKRNITLPNDLVPFHYDLKIHPIIDEYSNENFTFTGTVRIDVTCEIPSNKIVLNWENIIVNHNSVTVTSISRVLAAASIIEDDMIRKSEHTDETETQHNILDLHKVSVGGKQQNESTTFDQRSDSYELMEYSTMSNVDSTNDDVETDDSYSHNSGTVTVLGVSKIITDEENSKLTIELNEIMESGFNYSIQLEFFGKITDNLVGLYKTSYKDVRGQNRWLLTTAFQPIHARSVFPCWDEPIFKSTFKISIARRTNMTALSNMPLKTSEPMANLTGWVWDHFEKTLPMSPYLVAFTVFDFKPLECNSTCSESTAPITVWTAENDSEGGRYALESAIEIKTYLESYFGVKYPLPKLDLLALPNLGKSAIENWGIISFRKSSLLLNSKSLSLLQQPQIFRRISKQLALQWIGNLVTIKWWSDLWLKEGFANFISAVVEKELRPAWKTYNNFPLTELQNGLFLDSLKSSRSIQSKITDNEQIKRMGDDTLAHNKGSSLLRMLNYTMTKPIFQRALQNYVRSFMLGSAGQDEFWYYVANADNHTSIPTNITLTTIMDSWTKQPGYPCVTVQKTENKIRFTQKRFVEVNATQSTNSWYIPISYMTKYNDSVQSIWFPNLKEITIDISNVRNDSWILLNIHQSGFYRINYDQNNWDLLKKQLEIDHFKVPVCNRAQILDDSFELAKMDHLNYSTPFGLTRYLKYNESDYIAWKPALANLKYMKTIMDYHEYSGIFDTFLINLISKRFNILGTAPKSHDTLNDKFLRLEIIQLACQLYYQPCIDWAKLQLQMWMEKPDPDTQNSIPDDYREIVLCIAIRKGGRKEWDFLWQRTLYPSIPSKDLDVIYLTLGCSHDPWLLNRYLHFSLIGNVSIENVPSVWKSLSHHMGLRTAFPFLRLNWDKIHHAYKDIYIALRAIIDDFLSNLSTEIDLEDLTQFYTQHKIDLEPYATVMEGTVNKIKLRIEWKQKHLNSVISWLNKNLQNF